MNVLLQANAPSVASSQRMTKTSFFTLTNCVSFLGTKRPEQLRTFNVSLVVTFETLPISNLTKTLTWLCCCTCKKLAWNSYKRTLQRLRRQGLDFMDQTWTVSIICICTWSCFLSKYKKRDVKLLMVTKICILSVELLNNFSMFRMVFELTSSNWLWTCHSNTCINFNNHLYFNLN